MTDNPFAKPQPDPESDMDPVDRWTNKHGCHFTENLEKIVGRYMCEVLRCHDCDTEYVVGPIGGRIDPGDPVDHPSHYNAGSIEVIDAIEDWGLGFHLGNVVKYVARAEHKGTLREDLQKARWYLDRYMDRVER